MTKSETIKRTGAVLAFTAASLSTSASAEAAPAVADCDHPYNGRVEHVARLIVDKTIASYMTNNKEVAITKLKSPAKGVLRLVTKSPYGTVKSRNFVNFKAEASADGESGAVEPDFSKPLRAGYVEKLANGEKNQVTIIFNSDSYGNAQSYDIVTRTGNGELMDLDTRDSESCAADPGSYLHAIQIATAVAMTGPVSMVKP